MSHYKYLKYKKKYLILKNKLEGGVGENNTSITNSMVEILKGLFKNDGELKYPNVRYVKNRNGFYYEGDYPVDDQDVRNSFPYEIDSDHDTLVRIAGFKIAEMTRK